jgi:membrane-bound lytic murein transglycosylase D
MRKIFRDVGVPEDLIIVALAESGFNPRVRSRVGAAGLWQFMEATGAVYGLTRDYWVDERFDVERSTRAAALYLKDLRVRFGSWELALAAYNAGYGLVLTAIDRHNTNNYWGLCKIESGLPYATTNYVPKIVAAALVWHNERAFGLHEVERLPAVDWVEVSVARSTSLAVLAKTIAADPDLLAELNAHLVRGRTPPRRGGFTVRIPRTQLDAFTGSGGALQAQWRSEATHTVRLGENPEAIASAHGITERELRQLNGVEDSAELTGGVVLVVPSRPPQPGIPAPSSPAAPPLAAVPALTVPSGQRRVLVVANRATTPHAVESAFGVSWDQVVRWNDLDPHARLQANQVLQLLVSADFEPTSAGARIFEEHEVELVVRGSQAHLEAGLARRGLVRRGYRTRKNDTLVKVGRRFDLTVGDLARINGFARDHEPAPGEIMVVYVPAKRTGGTVEAPPPRTPVHASMTGDEPLPTSPKRPPSTSDTARVPGR